MKDMQELLWVTPLKHLKKRRPRPVFVDMAGLGAREVVVHLMVTSQVRRHLESVAQYEGRKGWSSAALAEALCDHIEHTTRKSCLIVTRRGACHFTVGVAEAGALAAELVPRHEPGVPNSEDEEQRAAATALELLRAHGSPGQVVATEQGMDMRWAALRALAASLGLGEPAVVAAGQYEARSSPDDKALRADAALRAHLQRMKQEGRFPDLESEPLGVVRVQPRGQSPWTAVAAVFRLPGTHPFFAAWSVDSKRVDG